MIRHLLLLLCAMLVFGGCAATTRINPSAEGGFLGKVSVDRSLMQSGGALGDELTVLSAPNGGVVLTVAPGTDEALSLLLPKAAVTTFARQLQTMGEWGEQVKQDKLDTIVKVGSLSCLAEPSGGGAVIGTRFISSRGGSSWLGQAIFCRLTPAEVNDPEIGACERQATFYLRPAEAGKLRDILRQRLAAVPL